MARLFEALAAFVVRFRVAIVCVWAVVMVAAILALPGLGSESNSDPSLFLSSGARSVEAASLGTALLGSQDTSKITIVAARENGPLTQADLAAVAREARLAEQVSGVVSARHLKRLAASGAGSISPDGRAVQFAVVVSHSNKEVAALRRVVNALEATFPRAGAPAGLRLHLAGPVATNAANNASANKATGKIGLFSILFIVALLLIVLRSPVAALITFVPSVVALLTAQRFIAGLGAHGLQISSVTQTLLVVLMLGAGTDYGLFLVYRFREELEAGAQPHAAVARALTRVGESVTASAGTVILALLTLLLAGFGLYRDLAVPLAVGVAVMLLAGLTLLPALLALFAGLVFPAPRPGAAARAGRRAAGDGVWARVAAAAVRRPGLTLGAGVAIFAALALATFGYQTAGPNRSTTAPPGSDAAAGNAIVAAHFPQSTDSPAHLVLEYGSPVWLHPDSLAQAAASLRGSGRFAQLAGPLNANGGTLSPQAYARARAELGSPKGLPLAEPAGVKLPRGVYDAYRATAQYVSPDGRTVQFLPACESGTSRAPRR